MILAPSRIMTWLKTYGTLKEDCWWTVPPSLAGSRLLTNLQWELEPEDYLINGDGSVSIFLDWDGALDKVPVIDLTSEMAIIGQLAGKSGWVPLKDLTNSDEVYIYLKIPDYQEMICD